MDKLRRMQGSAYEGVKSKVARNMKIVDRVNKVTRESCSPEKRPLSTLNSTMRASKSSKLLRDVKPWYRDCSNEREDHYQPVDRLKVDRS